MAPKSVGDRTGLAEAMMPLQTSVPYPPLQGEVAAAKRLAEGCHR
jgi:hypothetical protein